MFDLKCVQDICVRIRNLQDICVQDICVELKAAKYFCISPNLSRYLCLSYLSATRLIFHHGASNTQVTLPSHELGETYRIPLGIHL